MFNYFQPQQNYMGSYPQMQAQHYSIVMVNGEEGIKRLQIAPDSQLIAMDQSAEDSLICWFIKTDSAGTKIYNSYILTPCETKQAREKKILEDRISRLEEIINERPPKRTNESNAATETSTTTSATNTTTESNG